MLIVLSSAKWIADETKIVNQLFSAGMQRFHLRKPHGTIKEHENFLSTIEAQYHSRIVLHHHHELCNDFDLEGIHLTKSFRKELGDTLKKYTNSFIKNGKHCSTGFRSISEIEEQANHFTEVWLSPVFNSISKENYSGNQIDVRNLDVNVIALGGINEQNLTKTKALGYKGAAVLGGIWNEAPAVTNFKKIDHEYRRLKF